MLIPQYSLINHHGISGMGMDCENHGEKQAPEQAAEAAISLATAETLPGRHAGAPQAQGWRSCGSQTPHFTYHIIVILVICSNNPPLTQGKNKSLGFSEHHLIILY
jgi:hypothetical protein